MKPYHHRWQHRRAQKPTEPESRPVRAECVAQARQLQTRPGYPSDAIIDRVAHQILHRGDILPPGHRAR